jgi:O-glycosyl hydrolase
VLCIIVLIGFIAGGIRNKVIKSDHEIGDSEMENKGVENSTSRMTIDESNSYQVWESFGASGAWWSQYLGGWDEPYGEDTVAVRDRIASYLYSEDDGIGLDLYRYNIGAGSADSMNGNINDKNRRAVSFETEPGVYDWSKDENAVWFMKRVAELGAKEVVLFCNSPLERLTVNGYAHMSQKGEVNLLEENYDDFATYVCDVASHFIESGIPVKAISPINEPQWDWLNGQEGCHYEPKEVVGVFRSFLSEMNERADLNDVELTGPESGEWGGRTKEYAQAILQDDVLGKYFKTLDIHSYWSDSASKTSFRAWLNLHYPDLKLRMSEWCEMVNGKDFTMDSAFNMADVIQEDMTILNVTSWQCWVAISDGDYRDGLIYVDKKTHAYRVAKRMWGYGNYTKFINPSYQRVNIETDYSDIFNLKPVAFKGVNQEGKPELVMVFINREDEKELKLDIQSDKEYNQYRIYTTSEDYDLEETKSGDYSNDTIIPLMKESITTVVLSGN